MKSPSEQQVLTAIHELEILLREGGSIVLIRKNICKGNNNKLAKAMRAHPVYLEVLNNYMSSRQYNTRFQKEGKALKPVKWRG